MSWGWPIGAQKVAGGALLGGILRSVWGGGGGEGGGGTGCAIENENPLCRGMVGIRLALGGSETRQWSTFRRYFGVSMSWGWPTGAQKLAGGALLGGILRSVWGGGGEGGGEGGRAGQRKIKQPPH